MGMKIEAATSLESPKEESELFWEKEASKKPPTGDRTGFAYSGKNTFKSGEGEFTVLGQGDSFKAAHAYALFTDVPGASANSGATITAEDSNGKAAFVATETRGTTEQEVAAGAGSELKTLLDQSGKSDFLQLTSAAKRKINFGFVEVEWPGGNRASKVKTVTHGLGASPKAVVASASGFAGVYAEVASAGATTFEIRGTVSEGLPGAGAIQLLYWVAIG